MEAHHGPDLPLDQDGAVEAHRYLHDRKNLGKVVLEATSGPGSVTDDLLFLLYRGKAPASMSWSMRPSLPVASFTSGRDQIRLLEE